MSYVEMNISKGMKTIIDADVFDRLKKENNLKWNAQKSGKKFYVSKNKMVGNKSTKIYLHRYILNIDYGFCVDHINRNPLDNRKANLRICSHRQNAANKSPNNIKHSFKGVTKVGKFWSAQLQFNKQHLNLGHFSTIYDAARAYDIAAALLFKEFAVLNFPFNEKLKSIK